MMLIKFELYKIFSRRSIWVFIGVVMFFQLIVFYFGNGQVKLQKIIQTNIYNGVEGEYTLEKKKFIEDKLKDKKNDTINRLIQDELGRINLISNFKTALNDKITDIDKDIYELESKNDYGFKYQKAIHLKSMLSKIKEPQLYMNRGWIFALGTLNRDFFVVIIILYGVCTVFSTEYSFGTDSLILTSAKGRSKLVYTKLLASFILIITVFIIMTAFMLANLPYAYVLRGWDNTIQSVTTLQGSTFGSFEDSPYSLTIKQFIIVSSFVRLIGCLSVGFLGLFLSTLNRSSFTAFLISLGVVFIPSGLGLILKNFGLTFIYDFSFSSLLFPGDLFRSYKVYNIFGYPILHLNLLLIVYSVLTLILAYLSYHSFRNHQVC